ncbi:MAG: NTP transferase domain-containing protein [Candidatus Cloacimonetes bacterium]|nr:NTP transferase domain-containing protein [Candidatus Cloacimonadota bacterium]
MIGVIMAGGSGTRFWPLSREITPKQYLQLFSDKTMIQKTVERLFPIIGLESIYIVSTESQRPLIHDNIPNLPEENLIIEPVGRNTAPCIALSAAYLKRKYSENKIMFVLPSDHIIVEEDIFQKSIKVAEKAAKEGNLVTFGIKPDYPATGYGYIEAGKAITKGVHKITNFKEKPDFATAKSFLSAGNYLWNSGMFMWRVGDILEEYRLHAPEMYKLLQGIEKLWDEKGLDADISSKYIQMPKTPVDIAIMEKAEKRVVIPVNYHWNDVGSWRAVSDLAEKDKNGNAIKSPNIVIKSSGNYVYAKKLVAMIDTDNLVVIDTPDVLLITKKESSEKVKDVVAMIEKMGWKDYL